MKQFFRCGTAFTAALLLVLASVEAQERRDQDKAKPAQPNNAPRSQQPAQPARPAQPGQPVPGPRAGQQHGDSQLAACLISDNEGEIEIAKFALEKSQNVQVKEFAQQMVKDHGDFLAKLQRFAPASSGAGRQPNGANPQPRREQRQPNTTENPTNENRDAQNRDAQNRDAQNRDAQNRDAQNRDAQNRDAQNRDAQNRDAQNVAPRGTAAVNPPIHGPGSVDLIRIKEEIGRACVATLKKELGAKKGGEFDECYMTHQVGAHLHMIDTLKVMRKYAGPELQAVLAEGEKTATEHLDHARTLFNDLDAKSEVKRTAAAKDDATKEKD